MIKVSRRRSKRQSKKERHREATLQTDRAAQRRGASARIKGVMESISPGSDTGNYCNSFCHSPSPSSLALSLSPLSSLSQHKLLKEALQRLILFIYLCARVCVSVSECESVARLCDSCVCVSL